MSIDTILEFVSKYPRALVEITGGEPLLQDNASLLLGALLQRGRKVLIETNGSLDIAHLPIEVTIIMDIKCPDSGSPSSFLFKNLRTLKSRSILRPGACEIKFVLSSRDDYEWSKRMVKEHTLCDFAPVLFSPATGRFDNESLANAMLRDRLPVRLHLQLHKLIWPDIERGV